MVVMRLITITGTFTFFDIFMQLFVSWKKGPKIWIMVAPYIYYINTILTYFIWPGIIFSVSAYNFYFYFSVFSNSVFAGWVLTIMVLQTFFFIAFFTKVRNGPLKDSKEYLKLKKLALFDDEKADMKTTLAIKVAKEVLKAALCSN